MPFHPDHNLPGCMMPDGGECCAGHAAVCEDWHKKHSAARLMRKALEDIRDNARAGIWTLPETFAVYAESMLKNAEPNPIEGRVLQAND